jgi:hypothetical protein
MLTPFRGTRRSLARVGGTGECALSLVCKNENHSASGAIDRIGIAARVKFGEHEGKESNLQSTVSLERQGQSLTNSGASQNGQSPVGRPVHFSEHDDMVSVFHKRTAAIHLGAGRGARAFLNPTMLAGRGSWASRTPIVPRPTGRWRVACHGF